MRCKFLNVSLYAKHKINVKWPYVWVEISKIKLTQYQWRRSGIFIVNFEHISHLVLVFLLLTLSK